MWSIVRVVSLYSIFGFAWIFFSDALVLQLFGSSPELLNYMQSIKGMSYVFVTALLLAILLYYELRRYQKKEADFEQLFLSNPQPMWIYELKTLRFLEVNHAAIAKYGYSREKFRQLTIKDIRPPDDIPKLVANVENERPTLQDAGDWQHISKSGHLFIVRIISHRLDYYGKASALVMALDVTERRRLESHRLENQSLRIALEKEKEGQNRRSRFVSMVSHEFRNPLTVISTSMGIMQQMGEKLDSERRTKHFSKIEEQIKRLLELLDEMLAILRMEAANSNFQPEETNIVAFCKQVIESTQATYPNAPQIAFTAQAETILAEFDTKLMRRILDNLLTNAIKYSPDGGTIQLELQQVEADFVLTVRDEGIGIPVENLPSIFEPFFRANNIGQIQGTGLGLAIVKQAVDLHAGEIAVESDSGAGTTFTLKMPLRQVYSEELESYVSGT